VLAGGRGDVDEGVMDKIRRADAIDYRGFVDEAEKYDLLATCRALVFNGRDEDFGIVPIEANASGKAVLTRDEGFPAIFVDDGENGFRHDGSPDGIRGAIERLEREGIVANLGEQVETFSMDAFVDQLELSVVRRFERFRAIGERYQ